MRTGLDEERRAVNLLDMSNEDANFMLESAQECVNVCEACWQSGWDVLPDNLFPLRGRGDRDEDGNAVLSPSFVFDMARKYGPKPFVLHYVDEHCRVTLGWS